VLSKEDEIKQAKGFILSARNICFFAAIFSLVLAISGIYGLTANSIVQRTQEIGIRQAVGASDKQVVQLLLRQASVQLSIGLGVGVFLFGLISFALNSFTESTVPLSLYLMLVVVTTAVLAGVVLLAVYMPSRRASTMAPSVALRYE